MSAVGNSVSLSFSYCLTVSFPFECLKSHLVQSVSFESLVDVLGEVEQKPVICAFSSFHNLVS